MNRIYGHNSHINASFCYCSLASISYEAGNLKKAVEYQNQTVEILNKTLPSDDPRNMDAQKILKNYKELISSQTRNLLDPRKK